jgi:hypothetical protein
MRASARRRRLSVIMRVLVRMTLLVDVTVAGGRVTRALPTLMRRIVSHRFTPEW